YGAIKGRTASISAADCFAPVVLLYASPSWLRRIFGIPTDRELHQTSYLAGSPNGSVYCFSCKRCPPYHRGLIPGSRRHRAPHQLSVLTRPFPGGYPLPISGLFTLETETRLPRNWRITLEKKIPRGLSFILPPLANEKKIHERSFWNRKARNFTLPIEDSTVDGPSYRSFSPRRPEDEADCSPELSTGVWKLFPLLSPSAQSFLKVINNFCERTQKYCERTQKYCVGTQKKKNSPMSPRGLRTEETSPSGDIKSQTNWLPSSGPPTTFPLEQMEDIQQYNARW
ncbi:hypothetical protein AMECASPLE_021754, partial [Ameca splendens]